MTSEHWKEFQQTAYAIAKSKGFHNYDAVDPIIGPLQTSQLLFLIVTELVEAFDEVRAGHAVTEVYTKNGKPEGVPIELADAMLRIGDFAEAAGIDLGAAIEAKMAYNRTREYMHGKAF